jgi:hypothetical protein
VNSQEKGNVSKTRRLDGVADMALSIFQRVSDIKHSHPESARKIDRAEKEIRDRLMEIKKQIDLLDKKDRDLVTILVINGIHRTTDEVLVD